MSAAAAAPRERAVRVPTFGPGARGGLVDLAVIGAGGAGLAAAVHAAGLGLDTVLLEAEEPGGSMARRARIDVVAGHPVGMAGAELVRLSVAQAERFGARILAPARAVGLDLGDPGHEVRLEDGRGVPARAVLVASGTRRVLPGIPGLRGFLGAGAYLDARERPPATACGRGVVLAGDPVRVAAAAAHLGTGCGAVTLVTSGRGIPEGLRGGHSETSVRARTAIVALAGVDHLEAVVLRHLPSGRVTALEAAALYLLDAGAPRTDWLPTAVPRDGEARLVTGGTGGLHATDTPGVFAAGSVRAGGPSGRDALEDGIRAAAAILAYVAGRPPEPLPSCRESPPPLPSLSRGPRMSPNGRSRP